MHLSPTSKLGYLSFNVFKFLKYMVLNEMNQFYMLKIYGFDLEDTLVINMRC